MKIINPTKEVFVNHIYDSFCSSFYGIEPSYQQDIHLFTEDMMFNYCFGLITKGYFKHKYKESTTKEKETGILGDERYLELFKKSLDEVLNTDSIMYTKNCFPCTPGYMAQIDPYNNCEKIEICYPANSFTVFHPGEYLSKQVIYDMITAFCRDYGRISWPKLNLFKMLSKETVLHDYLEFQKTLEEDEKGTRPYEVSMTPQFLEDLFGKQEADRFKGQIEHGKIEDDGNFYAVLKDGSKELIGKPVLKVVKGNKNETE